MLQNWDDATCSHRSDRIKARRLERAPHLDITERHILRSRAELNLAQRWTPVLHARSWLPPEPPADGVDDMPVRCACLRCKAEEAEDGKCKHGGRPVAEVILSFVGSSIHRNLGIGSTRWLPVCMYEGPTRIKRYCVSRHDRSKTQSYVHDADRQCEQDVDTGKSENAKVTRARYRVVAAQEIVDIPILSVEYPSHPG